ncbi:O-antigen ligase family protein [Patescibacteria group bacterium]|nr:O-antigen ligase family protein [Patescibacteria group bacterium]
MREQLHKKLLKSLIFLTLVCSPLYVIRWQYSFLPTTLLEHLIILTLLLWIAYRISTKDYLFPRTKIDRLTALLMGACVLSLYQTPDLRGGVGIFKAYFVEPLVVYYIVIDLLRKNVVTQRLIVGGLVLASVWLSIMGFIQVGFGWFIVSPHEAYWNRAHAVFNSANALALFIGPVIALVIGYQLIENKKYDRLVRLGIFTILLCAIWLTKSTGALIAASCLIILFLSVQFLPWKIIKRISILALITYFIGQLVFLGFVSYFAPAVVNPWERSGGTEKIRLCVWEGTVNLLKENPILGTGLSGFKELYSSKFYTCDAEPLEYPHNLILNFWTETGLLGMLALVGIILYLFLTAFNASSAGRVNWAILGGIIYWLIHGLVDVPYFKNDLSLSFWIFLALSFWDDA